MAHRYDLDRTAETATTTGTGPVTLTGAVVAGFFPFAPQLADGDTFDYVMVMGADCEIGVGTWDADTDTFSRAPDRSTNGDAAVNWGAGSKIVFAAMPSARILTVAAAALAYQPLDADLTALAGLAAAAGLLSRTGAGAFAARTLASGNGIGITNGDGAAGNPTVAIDAASAADIRAGTANKTVAADGINSALAPVTLTDAGPVAIDWSTFLTANLTVTADRQLANPTNVVAGTTRMITILGNSSTDRAITFASNYKNAPTIADCDDAKAYTLTLYARTTTSIVVLSVGYAI